MANVAYGCSYLYFNKEDVEKFCCFLREKHDCTPKHEAISRSVDGRGSCLGPQGLDDHVRGWASQSPGLGHLYVHPHA